MLDSVIVLCFARRYFMSTTSFAIILMGKRELVALLWLSSLLLLFVVWLFLTVPLVYLQIVIVIFPDHTHLLFFKILIAILFKDWFDALCYIQLSFFNSSLTIIVFPHIIY